MTRLGILCGLLLMVCACKKQPVLPPLEATGLSSSLLVSGDAVAIYGDGFDPNLTGNIVLFNGVKGEVATASAHRLQVIVPILTSSGTISVSANGRTVLSGLKYTLLNLLQGTTGGNTTLSPDKKYLLRGNVVFTGKLIVQAGTIIFGEKATRAKLTVTDVDFEGSRERPIVFTSDQDPGKRSPGDWCGISVVPLRASLQQVASYRYALEPNGIMRFVRVEYAGYHIPGKQGQALRMHMDPGNVFEFIETSYSSGDGMLLYTDKNPANGFDLHTGDVFGRNVIAYSCAGADFHIVGNDVTLQFGLGVKDPYLADVNGGEGIWVDSLASRTKLSNFTLVGYNPSARGIDTREVVLNQNAGRGVRLGFFTSQPVSDNSIVTYEKAGIAGPIALYNSLIAGSYLAGISMIGKSNSFFLLGGRGQFLASPWDYYESTAKNPSFQVSMKRNFVVGCSNAFFPYRGGKYAKESYSAPNTGFEETNGDPFLSLFTARNDTSAALNLLSNQDDLGISELTRYANITQPALQPRSGSVLLTAAEFPSGSPVDDPFFNKEVLFSGAFGGEDWTKGWANYNPQTAVYR